MTGNKTPKNSKASSAKGAKANTANTPKTNTASSTSTAKTSAKKEPKKTKKQLKQEKNRKTWLIRVLAVLLVGVILGVSLLFEDNINNLLRLKGFIEEDYSGLSNEDVLDKDGSGVIKVNERLNVHFVDVGQGDACIIELPDEKKMIIDGGKDKEKEKLLSYIDENILDDEGKKIDKFDYAILTHSDEDHCGGLDDVLLKYPADIFYRPNQLATRSGYTDPGRNLLFGDVQNFGKDTLAYMRAIDAGHKAAKTVYVTDARKDVQNKIVPSGLPTNHPEYYEINFYTPTKDNYKDVNDYSPIMILKYQGKQIVLSGDAEAEAEAEFVEHAKKGEGKYSIFDNNFSVDLIKLGHHGSRSSSSTDYIETLTTVSSIQNVIIVVSCGTGNSYGHPHPDVIQRLLELGVKEENILRTDLNGNVAMSIKEDDNAIFQLYHGAEMVRVAYKEPLAWRGIAIIIFTAVLTLLIIVPFTAQYGKKFKSLKK